MTVPTQQMLNGLVPMPVNYDGGYIALSYIVSVMGSTTCLELLHRRSSRSGLLNWFVRVRPLRPSVSNELLRYLLLASSLSMGGIGIYSMHFVSGPYPALHMIYLPNCMANIVRIDCKQSNRTW